ncbi:HAD family hydrolase, partial [Deinococcus sp.]|uniref:HAD family hydrolase n=1 Tax=Deinococcus sp. TaxID=47478 RepID=UPI0025C4B4B6
HPPALLAFDLDGTLLADGGMELPGATALALARYRAHGVKLAVITGRDDLPPAVQALNPDAYALHNGARVVCGEEVVQEAYLPPAVLDLAQRTAPPGGLVLALTVPGVYADPTHFADAAALAAFRERWALAHRPFGPLARLGHTPLLGLWCFHPDVLVWKARVLAECPGLHVTGAQPPYADNMSLSAPSADKGAALLAVCRGLGIDPSQSWAFGDSDNDVAMFRVAGRAVQVGRLEVVSGLTHERVGHHLELGGWLASRWL